MGIVCVLLNGFANANPVAYPGAVNLVAFYDGADVCFNNDGAISSTNECGGGAVDEGYVYIVGGLSWAGGALSGIRACADAENYPAVSCTLTGTIFATCTNNEYVLV